MTLQPSIYPLILTAVILLAMAIEDYKLHSVKTWRSYVYEVGILVCIIINFIINWQSALVFGIVGVAIYLIAIPLIEKTMKDQYNYKFYPLDKQVFILTMIGFPFISLFAFLGNQAGNIFYRLIKRQLPSWSEEMPQLVVFGILWFIIAVAVLILYIR